MLKGFKEFVLRGNIVELAVAFVIGTAFARLVQTFVSAIITPLLSAIGGANSTGWGFCIGTCQPGKANFIDISVLINAIIVFVLTAALVYYLLVVPMNVLNAHKAAKALARGETPPAAEPTDVELLTEIRDLLQARQRS